MHGRGRCRDGGAENDCGGERDCCPARHFGISGLSCRGVTPNRLATAALSWLGNRWGWGPMTPSASGWVVQGEIHQIPASKMWISRGPPYRLSCSAKAEHPVAAACRGFSLTPTPNCRRLLDRPPELVIGPATSGRTRWRTMTIKPPSPRQNPSAPCASYPVRTR
jgi:hypothetical protein